MTTKTSIAIPKTILIEFCSSCQQAGCSLKTASFSNMGLTRRWSWPNFSPNKGSTSATRTLSRSCTTLTVITISSNWKEWSWWEFTQGGWKQTAKNEIIGWIFYWYSLMVFRVWNCNKYWHKHMNQGDFFYTSGLFGLLLGLWSNLSYYSIALFNFSISSRLKWKSLFGLLF